MDYRFLNLMALQECENASNGQTGGPDRYYVSGGAGRSAAGVWLIVGDRGDAAFDTGWPWSMRSCRPGLSACGSGSWGCGS